MAPLSGTGSTREAGESPPPHYFLEPLLEPLVEFFVCERHHDGTGFVARV